MTIKDNYQQQVEEAVSFLKGRMDLDPELIMVLGTGLGGLADLVEDPLVFPYEDIPHFPTSTVESHVGRLVFGRLAGRRVAILQGRFHYYEGYTTRELTFPVRVLSLLGADYLLVTNASGGLNPEYSPGTLMVMADHLNFIPDNPLRGVNVEKWGPRFPDCGQVYDRQLIKLTMDSAKLHDIGGVTSGVYVAIPGPSLETPAETRYLRNCGADAVGMSTVPEVLVGVHGGMRVLGLSLVGNVNDPDNQQPILLEDIIEQGRLARARLEKLILAVVADLPTADIAGT